MNKKCYPFLDGFRAIAILAVVLYHSVILFKSNNLVCLLLKKIFSIGHLGVDMFFVLSGFLITGILIESWNGEIRVKRFFVRRALKILPQYFFFLLIIHILMVNTNNFNWKDLVYNQVIQLYTLSYFFFFQNYMEHMERYSLMNHTWSLAVEEHFYLTYSLGVVLIFKLQRDPDKRRHYVIAGIVLCMILLFIDRWLGGGRDWLSRFLNTTNPTNTTFFRIDALLFGCLLRLFEPYYADHFKWSNSFATLCFLMGGLIFIFFIINDFLFQWGYFVLAYIASGLMILSAYGGFRPLISVTENKFMRWVGRCSYGIYLWHFLVLHFHRQPYFHRLGTIALVLSFVFFSILVGCITTVVIEKFFLKLRMRVMP
jgi:peptidoglycan/LPS O-acetylase OafA/YrhL